MNNRKRMILKSGEVCYRKSRMKKEHWKMWLSYPYQTMISKIKDVLQFIYGE